MDFVLFLFSFFGAQRKVHMLRKIQTLFYLLSAIVLLDAYPVDVRIHQRDIQALIFRQGKLTTGRRVSPRPQLQLEGWITPEERRDIPKEHFPTTIACKNMGWDGTQATWECETELPNYLRLGSTEVQCEGYTQPGDPEVLGGSCGLVYSLVKVGAFPGEEKGSAPYVSSNDPRTFRQYERDRKVKAEHDRTVRNIMVTFYVVVILMIVIGGIYWVFRTPSPVSRPSGYTPYRTVRKKKKKRKAKKSDSEDDDNAPRRKEDDDANETVVEHHYHHHTTSSPPPVSTTTYVRESSPGNFWTGWWLGSMNRSSGRCGYPSTTNNYYSSSPSSSSYSWFSSTPSSWSSFSSSGGGSSRGSSGSSWSNSSSSKSYSGTTSL